MTQFVILLEDGSLYKNVFVKIGRFFAENNSEIYWYLKENDNIEIFSNETNKQFSTNELKMITQKKIIETMNSKFISKNDIYHFTTSKNYKH